MHTYTRAVLILLFALFASCTLHASKQDPDKAAVSAVAFAKAALIERDMNKAYAMLDAEVQSNSPKEKFSEIVLKMASDKAPTSVTATDFEPIGGAEMMNIYLVGETNGEKLYYRVPMRGDSQKGYKPVGILRGHYAPSELRHAVQNPVSSGR